MPKRWLLGVGFIGMAVAFLVTALVTTPRNLQPEFLIDPTINEIIGGDATNGALVFAAAGCASCHAAEGTDALAGGKAFVSIFGTFYAPNISMDVNNGIGRWSITETANAIMAGVSPDGTHYYPAFPYASYAKMTSQDVLDLIAHLQTLPPDARPSRDHDIGFPFNIRRSIGIWKLIFIRESWVFKGDIDPSLKRGRYLIEALGHCAECHTPRNAMGGLQIDLWMRGAANPSGDGRIPSIHPDDLGWSAQDIAIYLDSGFTPDFDTVGGSMVDVVNNTAKLSDADREAIAAYLLAL